MNIKDLLFKLSSLDAVGNITAASDFAYGILSKYTTAEKMDNLTVIGFLDGKSDYTLMLDSHIDQIAMVVTDIDNNGFLTVSNAGGIDIRTLPSRMVNVHGKEIVPAVFCATPPHLSKGEESFEDIANIKLDTGLGKKAKEIISIGDFVTFSGKCGELQNDLVYGRSFDDRAAVACLLMLAQKLSGKKLPINVAFVLSDSEELGMRGVRTAAFRVNPNEAIAIDVSFGNGIGIKDEECGELSKGGMIGISPVLSKVVSNKLIAVAKENEIPYQLEVMGSRTGTNADMISINREGVKACTLSIPLRNMHSETEILSLSDLESVCDLLYAYIMAGGVLNA
ncbi:MAG: M20/M25/M40 family metallo-hydrolase [Clostridia bacterium]|nr:M20/M25/M40 family metallo-hydrolase [Clostridia bacterium]